MNNRKKQSVAAAMATVIGVGTLISPVAVHAQDEDPPTAITQETAVNSTQENDSSIQEKEKGDSALLIDTEYKNEIDTMRSSIEKNADDAFTDLEVAFKAIGDALNTYEFSNETTQQDIQDFLNQQFVDTGKLKEIPISNYSVGPNATITDMGMGGFQFKFTLMNGSYGFGYHYNISIPRLPKEGEVAINSKNFPDPIFRKYVKDNFDTVSDDVLSADEISNITDIDISQFADRVNIESLQGIEYFTELVNLNCYGSSTSATSLKSLDVSKNTKLETLQCGDNANLATLNVKSVKTLKNLQCYGTGITVLDVSENKALIHLSCHSTKIKILDVSKNTVLSSLYCHSNIELTTLNTKGADALESLDCKETGISILDVSENKTLTNLYCQRTEITSLNVSENKLLESLYCGETEITSLDVSKNTALGELSCTNTPLAWLNIGMKTGLWNRLPTPTISTNMFVDSFNIKNITEGIDLEKITIVNNNGSLNKTTGIISNYDMKQPIQYEYDCGTLDGQPLKLSVNIEFAIDINEANFPDDTFREYVIKNFDKDTNYKLTPNEINNITVINVIGFKDLKSIKGIEYFSALEELYCRETAISSLDVSRNTALKRLDCSKTDISVLDLSKHSNLEYVTCYDTKIEVLDVSRSANLYQLICYSTKIEELKLDNNSKLRILSCYNTNIKKLDVSKNELLETFMCSDTKIQELNITANTKLKYLDCANTDIKSLNTSMNKDLSTLQCRNTKISDLDVSANKKLESFDCSYTKISKLDVSNNDKLYNFDCRNNSNLTSLNVDGATNLGYFFCSDTGITSLDVSNNKNLVYLEAKIKSLAWLNIGSNSNLSMFHKIDSSIDLKITGNTFNIQDVFQGIDVDKVAIISNGSLDKDKGIVTVNKADQPVVYTYNCGTSKNGEQTIHVTLNLNIEKKDSSVTINKDLNKIYDNNPIDNATVDKTGSSGVVTFTYEVKKGDKWETYNGVPVSVGKYRITAHLAGDDFFNSAKTTEEFAIVAKSVENNSQIVIPDINNDKDLENLVIKDGDKELEKGTDYDVDKKQNGNEVIVTITFKGNYAGTITKTYTVNIDTPKETESIQTGDNTHTGLLATMSLLSAGCIAFLTGKKRKKEYNK